MDRLEVANALLVLTKQGLAALATELAGYRQRHVGAALTVVEDWLETSRGEWLRVACVVLRGPLRQADAALLGAMAVPGLP